MLCEI